MAELKGQLRILPSDNCQEWELDGYITMARIQFEQRTDEAVMLQTWALGLPEVADLMTLDHPPLANATLSYVNTDGVTGPVDPTVYEVIQGYPGRIWRVRNQRWPTDFDKYIAYPWSITFQCGYATPDTVPRDVRHAILLLAAFAYENRLAAQDMAVVEMPHGFEAIVNQHRVHMP